MTGQAVVLEQTGESRNEQYGRENIIVIFFSKKKPNDEYFGFQTALNSFV